MMASSSSAQADVDSGKRRNAAAYCIFAAGFILCLAPVAAFLYRYSQVQASLKAADRIALLSQSASAYLGLALPLLIFLLVCSVLAATRAFVDRAREASQLQSQAERSRVDLISVQNELMLAEMRKGELSKIFFDMLGYKLSLLESLSFVSDRKEYRGKAVVEVHRSEFAGYIAFYRTNREYVDARILKYEKGFVGKRALGLLIDKAMKPLVELELHAGNIRSYVKYVLMIYKTIHASAIALVISDYTALFFSQISQAELFVIAYYGFDLFNELGIDPYAFFIEADVGVQLVSELLEYGKDLGRSLGWKRTLHEIRTSIQDIPPNGKA